MTSPSKEGNRIVGGTAIRGPHLLDSFERSSESSENRAVMWSDCYSVLSSSEGYDGDLFILVGS